MSWALFFNIIIGWLAIFLALINYLSDITLTTELNAKFSIPCISFFLFLSFLVCLFMCLLWNWSQGMGALQRNWYVFLNTSFNHFLAVCLFFFHPWWRLGVIIVWSLTVFLHHMLLPKFPSYCAKSDWNVLFSLTGPVLTVSSLR